MGRRSSELGLSGCFDGGEYSTGDGRMRRWEVDWGRRVSIWVGGEVMLDIIGDGVVNLSVISLIEVADAL